MTAIRKPGARPGFLMLTVFAPLTHAKRVEYRTKFRCEALVLFLTNLLTIPLACQCFLDALLFAGLQVEGVALDFLADVFLLNLPLKAAQCILKWFALLETYFCHVVKHPALRSR